MIPAVASDSVASPRKVLIVEDCGLTGLALAELLRDEGYDPIGPFRDLRTAAESAAHEEVHAALLDVSVGRETTFKLAESLRARGVPFAFLSGHDPEFILPPELRDSAFLCKPFKDDQVLSCLDAFFGSL